MTVLRRYLLIQSPGWVLAAIILYGLHRWLALPVWLAAVLLAAEVIKDLVLFPHLRRAYEGDDRSVTDRLVGETATAHEAIAPEGYVWIRGELWRARLAPGEAPIEVGSKVRITHAAGLEVEVARPAEERSGAWPARLDGGGAAN